MPAAGGAKSTYSDPSSWHCGIAASTSATRTAHVWAYYVAGFSTKRLHKRRRILGKSAPVSALASGSTWICISTADAWHTSYPEGGAITCRSFLSSKDTSKRSNITAIPATAIIYTATAAAAATTAPDSSTAIAASPSGNGSAAVSAIGTADPAGTAVSSLSSSIRAG